MQALKIEGTAPFNLTFTFGGASLRRDGRYFLKYSGGRKILKPGRIKSRQNSSGDDKMTA